VIVGFVDDHRDELGVEPICRALQIAPSTYYAAKRRELAPSARAVRDAVMMQMLMVLWVANRKVYGPTSSGRPPAAPVTTSVGTRSPA
jgi:putative transposase